MRDRIRELRRVRARELQQHPGNWRVHPQLQQTAVRDLLDDIGYADALIARETDDGALQLIDGHLRAEITPDDEVPVLIVDLDEVEARKLLAFLDPVAGLAEADVEALATLLADVETESDALEQLLRKTMEDAESVGPEAMDDHNSTEPSLEEIYHVVVACDDEPSQRALYERLTSEGYSCRLETL